MRHHAATQVHEKPRRRRGDRLEVVELLDAEHRERSLGELAVGVDHRHAIVLRRQTPGLVQLALPARHLGAADQGRLEDVEVAGDPRHGDRLVATAGLPLHARGTTNLIRMLEVRDGSSDR